MKRDSYLLTGEYIKRQVTALGAVAALSQGGAGDVVSRLLKVEPSPDEVSLHFILRVEHKEVIAVRWHSEIQDIICQKHEYSSFDYLILLKNKYLWQIFEGIHHIDEEVFAE